jgi:hypothetical protein
MHFPNLQCVHKQNFARLHQCGSIAKLKEKKKGKKRKKKRKEP